MERKSPERCTACRDINRLWIFRVVCLVFAVAGILLRIAGGNRVILSDLMYSPGMRMTFPGTRTPENTVKSFYLYLDRGEYDRAWEISLEADWTGGNMEIGFFDEVSEDQERFRGWVPKERFVQRMEWELGKEGTGITLKSVEARIQRVMDSEEFSSTYHITSIEKAYLVEVTGRLLGTCSLFQFRKMIPVLVVEGKYKVFLSGTKKKESLFYQSWFSNLKIAGSLWEQ